jgi:DNA-binding response OmpR family regulator
MSCRAVVVVERDRLIRETLVEALLEQGYAVHAALDAGQARAILGAVPHPCLLLVDLLSAGSDGNDFLQMRRDDDIMVQIPLALMSSVAAGPDDEAWVRGCGANLYLKKPFDLDRLLDAVREFCGTV